jgi:flagellar hook-basal body complex protein FliE
MSGIGPIGSLPLFAPHLTADAVGAQLPDGGTVVRPPTAGTAQIPFADLLANAIASANDKQVTASHAAEAFAAGARDDIHGTMIAIKEAEIELKLVGNVRNKLLDAFNDLWRLNV